VLGAPCSSLDLSGLWPGRRRKWGEARRYGEATESGTSVR
jgi:hypothetical protein